MILLGLALKDIITHENLQTVCMDFREMSYCINLIPGPQRIYFNPSQISERRLSASFGRGCGWTLGGFCNQPDQRSTLGWYADVKVRLTGARWCRGKLEPMANQNKAILKLLGIVCYCMLGAKCSYPFTIKRLIQLF